MTDSFFGFDTALDPTLLRGGTLGDEDGGLGGGIEDEELDSRLRQFTLTAGDDIEIYDYDDLGDRLEETNDDLNDETFGDDPAASGKDFDFSGRTAQMAPSLESEMALRKQKEEKGGSNLQSNRPELQLHQQQQHLEQSKQIPSSQRRPSYAALWDDAKAEQAESSIWSTFSPFQSTFGPDALSPSFAPGRRGSTDASPRTGTPNQAIASPSSTLLPQRVMTVEEIEAELLRRNRGGLDAGKVGGTKMMSVQEIEAAMRGNRKGGVPVGIGGHEQPERPYDAERERRKEERMREMAEAAKYNNLMTQYDKGLIARIQISQLVTDDPYKDDFYYQVYTAIRSRLGLPPNGGPPLNSMGRPENDAKAPGRGNRSGGKGKAEGGMLRMQQQVQRIVHNNQQRKPKSTQLTLEGALGKVTSSSSRNPRVLLQVKPRTSNEESKLVDVQDKDKKDVREERTAEPAPKISAKPRTMGNHRRVLRSIENVYNGVLALEQLRRVQPPVPRPDAPEDVLDGFRRWNRDYASFVKDVWKELRVMEPIGTSYPHPFIALICTAKGKKVIPRVLRHALPEQILALLSMLIANLESVDAVAQGVYGPTGAITSAAQESENTFMNTIVPPAMAFVAESPLGVVVGLLTLFLEKNNVAWAARGKIGLVLLTMLLSRAEILKQGGGALQGLPPPTEDELARCATMYLRTFNSLQGHFAHIFPPQAANVNDVYVWQFLAAIAVGASMEQQHILVTEVRERVLEAVVLSQSGRLSKEKASAKISNCNLFLHALGLDASQVVV